MYFPKKIVSLQSEAKNIHSNIPKIFKIRAREKKSAEPLSEKDKRTAEEFIRKYYKNIIHKWVKFFVLKQSVRSTRINKKL